MSDRNCQPGADDTNMHERPQEESLGQSVVVLVVVFVIIVVVIIVVAVHPGRPSSSYVAFFHTVCLFPLLPLSLSLSFSLSRVLVPSSSRFFLSPSPLPAPPKRSNPPRPSRSHARRPLVQNEVGWRYYGLVRAIQPRQLPFFLTRGGQLLTGTAFLRASMPRLSPFFLSRLLCLPLSLSLFLSRTPLVSRAQFIVLLAEL